MGRKILFFDIDGTLVDTGDRLLPRSAVDAIRTARARGHLAYINSGRPWCGIDGRLRELGFDGFACGCGSYIRVGEEVLLHRRPPREGRLALAALVRELDLQAMYEGPATVGFDCTRRMEPYVEEERAYYERIGAPVWEDPLDPGSDFDKFVVWAPPGEARERFRRAAEEWYEVIEREGTMLEMVPKGCSKGKAMELLMARHGLTRGDCVAVGDGVNDLPMLRCAGVSVAMGNSDRRILSRVDLVTSSLREDGIARALEKLGII